MEFKLGRKQYVMGGTFIIALIVSLAVFPGVFSTPENAGTDTAGPDSPWRTTTLTDVRTGEQFSINQFDDPVLVETFAVWCPTCTRQQQEITALHETADNDIVSVSLNTDPNEDANKVQDHINRYGFDWRYVVAPPTVIQSLIDDYGRSITNAPLVPKILVCPDGTAHRLENGVKTAETLQDTVSSTCSQ